MTNKTKTCKKFQNVIEEKEREHEHVIFFPDITRICERAWRTPPRRTMTQNNNISIPDSIRPSRMFKGNFYSTYGFWCSTSHFEWVYIRSLHFLHIDFLFSLLVSVYWFRGQVFWHGKNVFAMVSLICVLSLMDALFSWKLRIHLQEWTLFVLNWIVFGSVVFSGGLWIKLDQIGFASSLSISNAT